MFLFKSYGILVIFTIFQLCSGSNEVRNINAFIAEKIVYKQRMKSNPKMFWIYAEMLIDSKRHYLLDKIEIN